MTTEHHPNNGGSYIRQPDGTLIRADAVPAKKPAEKKQAIKTQPVPEQTDTEQTK